MVTSSEIMIVGLFLSAILSGMLGLGCGFCNCTFSGSISTRPGSSGSTGIALIPHFSTA